MTIEPIDYVSGYPSTIKRNADYGKPASFPISFKPVVWVAQYNCGDYYCDGMHLIGVFVSKTAAEHVCQTIRDRNDYAAQYEYNVFSINMNEDLTIGEIAEYHKTDESSPIRVPDGYALFLVTRFGGNNATTPINPETDQEAETAKTGDTETCPDTAEPTPTNPLDKRKLIGPPHAHLDAPCTDACYEPDTKTNPLGIIFRMPGERGWGVING